MESLAPSSTLGEVAREAPHGLMFHHFHDRRHPRGQGAIDATCFEAVLTRTGLGRFLPAGEFMRRAMSKELRRGDLCVTFDDALRCQYDVALPVLRRLGLTAFWFVYSGVFEGQREPLEIFRYFRTVAFSDIDSFYAAFDAAVAGSQHADLVARESAGVDFSAHLAEVSIYSLADRRFRYLRDRILGPARYTDVMWTMIRRAGYEDLIPSELLWMDDANLRELQAEGHVIGLHSYSHPTELKSLPIPDQREEYRRNAAHLLRVTGQYPIAMSHPCNSYGPDTLQLLKDMGVAIGFRANMAKADFTELELPRIDHAILTRELGLT
jgi:peptidoglycan/xylan/chitin deacetylase (PgdA/CDA1 family)